MITLTGREPQLNDKCQVTSSTERKVVFKYVGMVIPSPDDDFVELEIDRTYLLDPTRNITIVLDLNKAREITGTVFAR
jgi:hypothetical protein